MTFVLWGFAVCALVAVLWHIWGAGSSRVEQMRYTVLEKKNGYEVREYPERIVAQARVTGRYPEALYEGFRIVAGYIFGGNVRKASIKMTAPVVETPVSEKIAMTAPVTASIEGDTHVISFGMPASYELSTLPEPTDARVTLVTLPKQTFAVLRFSGYATASRVAAKKKLLASLLVRDGMPPHGAAAYAGYNAPFTPPWLTRNEVLIPIA